MKVECILGNGRVVVDVVKKNSKTVWVKVGKKTIKRHIEKHKVREV